MSDRVDVLLSLGSNKGDRQANLIAGVKRLADAGLTVNGISPVVESPALLPQGAPSEWNRPYLNIVAKGIVVQDFDTFYKISKAIQEELGPRGESKWAPRNLDIDILTWGSSTITYDHSTVPSQDVFLRPFVISPLIHLDPSIRIPVDGGLKAFELSQKCELDFHIPLWMGIVNVTPDSFSDGGANFDLDAMAKNVKRMIECGVNIVDLGAESTRPNAKPLSLEEEWNRLKEPLQVVKNLIGNQMLRPKLSIDTYHAETAERALVAGVDMINDVSGLETESMIRLAKESDLQFIAMHSVTVPVNPDANIPQSSNSVEVIKDWIIRQQRRWESAGLNLDKIVVDPGIGFGKSSLQSLDLMRSVRELRQLGQQVLVGHSRKRFMRSFTNFPSEDLDFETIGASLNLCEQGVDILRIHNVESHKRAYLSWLHLKQNREAKAIDM